ncbi:hypothetical protein A5707_04620 [Mycobacterium kyorinense]|uniref:DUF4878 domain-containing protein n=1 Tax=Mycobacterium kyorinense TaxID=487514 RepID=A0A1A2Z215_9MYCO|nr:hypothetical protein [Mycobacterium kyorinense]OBI43678.1 hypothetical protein A5707_04620 [Mycobacterium kyorinense]
MPTSPGPDRDSRSNKAGFDPDAGRDSAGPGADPAGGHAGSDDEATEAYRRAPSDAEPATEVIAKGHDTEHEDAQPQLQRGERRFTAPGFDANETAVIDAGPEPATEVFQSGEAQPVGQTRSTPRAAVPQLIPPRLGGKLRPTSQRSWGWVLALILIILALAAIAVLGTVLLTHGNKKKAASQEDEVRSTIQSFDVAVQNGDLAALRGLTCGTARDGYVNYDEHAWDDTYQRVAAAKQYPVVASIDQIVVNDGHAEANVTAFMAYAPQVRSTRSFDLQYRDDQWKICQSTG